MCIAEIMSDFCKNVTKIIKVKIKTKIVLFCEATITKFTLCEKTKGIIQ